MNYEQTMDYLFSVLPMYQRVGAIAYKIDLGNIVALTEALGNPQDDFKSVHIAGTNGKGSSSHMIAAIMQASGYKTGLYTSPHLKSFTERIRVDGNEIPQEAVVDFVASHKELIEEVKPSFFEITVAMAFQYFSKSEVDLAVIEVGLGGRLDSTNIITPEVSLITSIGLDHQALLGNTLQKIAAEKAGIIKEGVPVVISKRQPETAEVFEKKACEMHSEISFASDKFHIEQAPEGRINIVSGDGIYVEGIRMDLQGFYQNENLLGVIETVEKLRQRGFDITDSNIRAGLGSVVSTTGLKGRWQHLGDEPMIICDTGHNEDGVKQILNQLEQTPHGKLFFVWGSVNDKEVGDILRLLPKDAYYFFTQSGIPRALPKEDLMEKARAFDLSGELAEDVNEGIARALAMAEANDLIFVGGSTFIVAEIEGL